ncbi:MAG: shikimate dehydrogenase [Parvularcula sp.]|nr:shikimate dehydrogenase [Parvularcula sp.]
MIRAAVIGDPVEHSLSPRLMARWFQDAGIEGHYRKVQAPSERFAEKVHRLRSEGYAGVNVTIPHKEAALALADRKTEAAALIGAANLLTFGKDGITADNTDHVGFARALERAGGKLSGGRAVVLGAGGAAGAIIHALHGYEAVRVVNRTFSRAEALAARFPNAEAGAWDERDEAAAGADLLVNTTSLGMKGQPPLTIDLSGLPNHAVVADIVYVPLYTPLLCAARARGLGVAHGLAMLVHQAVPSFEAFTGQRPPHPETILSEIEAEAA